MDPFLVDSLVIPIAGMITGVVISIGFFKTVRHLIDRKGARSPDANLTGEVADLHARIDALERRTELIDELEDRVDFAERLLARGERPDPANKER